MCYAQNEWHPEFKVSISLRMHTRSNILKPFSGRAAECVLITVCDCVVTTQSQLTLPEWDFPLFSPLTPQPLFHLNFSCISLHLFLRQKIIISQERQFPAPMVSYTLPVKGFRKLYAFFFDTCQFIELPVSRSEPKKWIKLILSECIILVKWCCTVYVGRNRNTTAFCIFVLQFSV